VTGQPRARGADPQVAYAALSEALVELAPRCRDDVRFTLDGLQHDEVAFLSMQVCWPCPVRTLCHEYAEAARPDAGVLAGRVYGPAARGRHRVELAPD
jgi:hypothetical protein